MVLNPRLTSSALELSPSRAITPAIGPRGTVPAVVVFFWRARWLACKKE